MSKTTPKKLTPRQQEVLEFIRGCIEDKYPPTLHEIGSHFGFSEKAATDHVNAIEKKGYIQRVPNVPAQYNDCRAATERQSGNRVPHA